MHSHAAPRLQEPGAPSSPVALPNLSHRQWAGARGNVCWAEGSPCGQSCAWSGGRVQLYLTVRCYPCSMRRRIRAAPTPLYAGLLCPQYPVLRVESCQQLLCGQRDAISAASIERAICMGTRLTTHVGHDCVRSCCVCACVSRASARTPLRLHASAAQKYIFAPWPGPAARRVRRVRRQLRCFRGAANWVRVRREHPHQHT